MYFANIPEPSHLLQLRLTPPRELPHLSVWLQVHLVTFTAGHGASSAMTLLLGTTAEKNFLSLSEP